MPHRKRSHRWWKNPNPHIKGRTGHQRGRPNLKWGQNLPDVLEGNADADVQELTVQFRAQLHEYRRRLYDLDYSTDPEYQQQHQHRYYGLCNELSVLLDRHLTVLSSTDVGRRAVQECQQLIADIEGLMPVNDRLIRQWNYQLGLAKQYRQQAFQACRAIRSDFDRQHSVYISYPNAHYSVDLPGLGGGHAEANPENPDVYRVKFYKRYIVQQTNNGRIDWCGYMAFPAAPGHSLTCPVDQRLHLWFRLKKPIYRLHGQVVYDNQQIWVYANRQPYAAAAADQQPPNLETVQPSDEMVPYNNNGYLLAGQSVKFVGQSFYVMAESTFQQFLANRDQFIGRFRTLERHWLDKCNGTDLVCKQLWERYEREQLGSEDAPLAPLYYNYDEVWQKIEAECRAIKKRIEEEILSISDIIKKYTQQGGDGVIIPDRIAAGAGQ